jgi:TRAP-type mannitol/chloroaromatic compound transport system permease small subunit
MTMLELPGKFLKFVGDIVAFFWVSFFEDPGAFFATVAASPLTSPFELLFVLFLVGVAVTVVVGVVGSAARRDPYPFIRAVEFYTRIFGLAGAWIIVVLIAAMVYEVIARYFLAAPTKWAFEVAYMLMGTSFMFGIAYCMQMRRHVRVDFVYNAVGPKARATIDLVGYVVLVPMILWLCAGLWDYFHQAYKVNELSGESAWNPIIWPFKFTFVIGFVLLLMQTMAEALKRVLVLAGREVPEPEAMVRLE